MRLGRTAVAAGVLAALASTPACRERPKESPPPRNLVFVTIDTLRADRVGAYGRRGASTPHLDGLARGGALALDASVHAPLTRPSHVSMFTGLLPAQHGIRDNVSPSLADDVPTLAEAVKAAGFETAAFVSSIVLSRQSGLARGFDTYSDRFEAGGDDARFLNTIQKRGDGPTDEAVAWLEGRRSGRFFLWLHLYDPHDPYDAPEPFASRYRDRPYDGEVAYADALVGRLDDALGRRGLRDSTLFVVTSDHGEGLGDHGEAVHGYFVYESTLAVPLLFRGPGIPAGTRVATTVRSVDLLPTFLDLLKLGAPSPRPLAGRSLAATLRGGPEPVVLPTYAESLTPLLHYGWSDLRALREGRFKYIEAPRPELYDLKSDPGESRNLVKENAGQAEALRKALLVRLEEERGLARAPAAAAAVPPELLDQLGALGYVGSGGASLGESRAADPKDKLEEYSAVSGLMREGLTLLREKKPSESAKRLRELRARGIDGFEVRYYLARALLQADDAAGAVAEFEAAIARLPAYGAAYVGLADAHMAKGDSRAALAALRRGQEKAPRDARLVTAEARILRALEKPQEAMAAYERALPLAPKDALLRITLGEMYRDARRPDRAIALMREAVAKDPEPAEYWNALGMVLGGDGRLPEAEAAFREAVKRDAKDAQFAYNLGLALLRQGKAEEAAASFRGALALEPRFGAARDRLAELAKAP